MSFLPFVPPTSVPPGLSLRQCEQSEQSVPSFRTPSDCPVPPQSASRSPAGAKVSEGIAAIPSDTLSFSAPPALSLPQSGSVWLSLTQPWDSVRLVFCASHWPRGHPARSGRGTTPAPGLGACAWTRSSIFRIVLGKGSHRGTGGRRPVRRIADGRRRGSPLRGRPRGSLAERADLIQHSQRLAFAHTSIPHAYKMSRTFFSSQHFLHIPLPRR